MRSLSRGREGVRVWMDTCHRMNGNGTVLDCAADRRQLVKMSTECSKTAREETCSVTYRDSTKAFVTFKLSYRSNVET
jgi:hypothetical protein